MLWVEALLLAATAAAAPLDDHLDALAAKSWQARSALVAALDRQGAERRRDWIRQRILEQIGGLPAERTPLNARITGSLTREGYRVEKLIFESLPRFYVTANVYVPAASRPPFPAVVGVAGHSGNGKAAAVYQHVWISLARRGFLVLAFDPPGQGERSATFDPVTGASRAGIGTREHILEGTQCLLTGSHFASYEIWDGIRAVDYLLTRNDVDAKRIAVAGNSGGGTQAAYLAAVEPRLAAIVSSCYMTSWRQLWFKPGPQDAEQVFPGFLRDELEFADFAFAAAPKPFLMTTAIRDFFPIEGARQTYQEIRSFYALLDAEAKAGYFEYDDAHGWSLPRRQAAYRFLTKWLQGKEDSGEEGQLRTEAEQHLYATPTGQVLTSLGGETIQSINARQAQRLYANRSARQKLDPKLMLARTAYEPLSQPLHEARWVSSHNPARPVILALNAADADMAEMAAAGYAVLALRFPIAGPGRADSGYTPQYQTASRAMLVGRTLVGLLLSDVLHGYRQALATGVDPNQIRIYGRGNAGVLALHAAVLIPQIRSVAVEATVLSYLAVTQAKYHQGLIDIVIPGVLRDYDLPDLVRTFGPKRTWLVDMRGPAGATLLLDEVRAVYPEAHAAYRPEGWPFGDVYREWLSDK